jgi:hypothetical protein
LPTSYSNGGKLFPIASVLSGTARQSMYP